uniref:F-box domain-containing protein n=1 Tax=Steinernema glaseri TaxID=37863 RepID=A0A1I7YNH3_9BILA
MHFFNSSPRFDNVRIETVSLYCSKDITQFVNGIKYVEELAVKHIRYLHLYINFYDVHNWDEFKKFKTFLDTTSLNIESLDIRIYFRCGPRRFPANFKLKEIFDGLSRHHNLKKFCLSGKLDGDYSPVVLNAIIALSKLEYVTTVVFDKTLKLFNEGFWSRAVKNLPTSVENLTISSAHCLKDHHVYEMMERLPKLRRFALHGTKKLTIDGVRHIFSHKLLTHLATLRTGAVTKNISELLKDCPTNLKAVMACSYKEKFLKAAVKDELNSRYSLMRFSENNEEIANFYEIATSEQELRTLKDISRFFYCDHCNMDVLTNQYC